jgi:hypothetical protein
MSGGKPQIQGEVFASLVGTFLPFGGNLVALVEAHFDESIGTMPRRVLCVAGYIMTDRAARRLTREWCNVLNQYQLPYFRMSACAHGNYPFRNLSIEQRIAVEKRVIDIAKSRTIKWFAVVIDLDDFDQYMPKHELIGNPYTFCAHVIIGGIAHWVADSKYDGDIAYVFEAGHESEREAGQIMQKIFHYPGLKSAQRYASHAFVDKAKSPPTQAADLLSWHTYTDLRHRLEGRPRRKDFASLLRPRTDFGRQILKEEMIRIAADWDAGNDFLAGLYHGNRPPRTPGSDQ